MSDYNREDQGVPVDSRFRRKVLITALCSDTGGCQKAKQYHTQGGVHRTERRAMLLSEHLCPQTLSNYPAVFTTQRVLPGFNPRSREGSGRL